MNEETWKKIHALNGEIRRFKEVISVTNSEQAAATTMQERWGIDHNPCIAQMLRHGGVLTFYYYRSDEWINQPIDLSDMGISAYTGPLEKAPVALYGPGTYIVDEGITHFHRKTIQSYSSAQTVMPSRVTRKLSRGKRLV